MVDTGTMSSGDKPRTSPRSLRQQQRTRRQLLDAGRNLIAAKGVAGLRVQEVTELADVALGTFYNYFPSKTELLEAIILETLTELASFTIDADGSDADPADVVAVACLRVVGLATHDPELARLVVNIAHSEALFGQAVHPHARTAVDRGVSTGRFSVPDTDILLTTIIGGAFALIREVLDGRHGQHAPEAFSRCALATLGIRPDEAAIIVARAASGTTHRPPAGFSH